ncbi:DUF3644 domain-containing protein [Streptobacillus moniliformis]|uniref:DUF3644 domain-containing protein n=1 Tax=Streptobacillus moniliformis TaxID=34105 RepID=UPI0007E31D41|nr:DUF3644 domain-containing protein [Streptobacillus moniliformis]
MENKKNKLIKRLVDKSIEAFIMGLEIYNKPTIKYRIEGFSFFICNAWELMLKSYLLKQNKSIYFKKEETRSISLTNTIKQIFTNKKDPLRINIETINELRNTSTHFITEDHEKIYAPLFQACVKNYCDKLYEFHSIEISNLIPQDFLTLRISFYDFNETEIKAKYPVEIAEKLIFSKNNIDFLSENNNSAFAFNINYNLQITKDKEKADLSIAIDRNSENIANIIKEYKDPNKTHKFSYANVITEINYQLFKNKIPFEYYLKNMALKKEFTTNVLNLFMQFYDIKSNKIYTFEHKVGNNIHRTYSKALIDFIVVEIKKDPKNIYKNIKKGLENKKR